MSKKNTKKRNTGQRPRQQRSTKQGGRAPMSVAPVAIGNRTFQSKPTYRSQGDRLIVKHSEYIGDILGNASPYFVSQPIPMNPGMSTTFPWLNQIASRYESYLFRKLHFRFMTEQPTTQSGYVGLIPDYDPTDAAPVDKQTAFQFQASAKSAPWENLTQVNSPKDLRKRESYFVRQGNLAANENLGLYDSGNLFTVVGGNSGTVTLGELWCDYEVEFFTPQLDSNYGSSDSGITNGAGAPFTGAAIFGTAPVSSFARASLWLLTPASGTFVFQRNYQGLITLDLVGTGITLISVAGSANTSAGTVINATATGSITRITINALQGQTLVLTAAATTVVGSILRSGAYQFALG